MARQYLHEHRDFGRLLRIVSEHTGIDAGLVEIDFRHLARLFRKAQPCLINPAVLRTDFKDRTLSFSGR
jgi:hypothetical protein